MARLACPARGTFATRWRLVRCPPGQMATAGRILPEGSYAGTQSQFDRRHSVAMRQVSTRPGALGNPCWGRTRSDGVSSILRAR